MSPKNLRVPLLGACLVALALVAMPLGTAPDMDNEFDVAARAEMGKEGREVQAETRIASRAEISPNGRVGIQLASRAEISPNGRFSTNAAVTGENGTMRTA